MTVRRVFTLFALLAALTPGRSPAQVTTTGNIRVAVTDHSQDNDPKEPPKREEDTLTKHNIGGFPRTRGDGPRRVTIVIDNSSYRSNNTPAALHDTPPASTGPHPS